MEGEGEGEEDSSISSVFSPLSVLCPVFILFVSIPCFSSCLPSGYLLFHLPHANTHFLFSLFFSLSPLLHTEALIFYRRAPTSVRQ